MIQIKEFQFNKEIHLFEDMGLNQQLIQVLSAYGYMAPKYLQRLSVPHLISKKDCVIVGPFQSGKRIALVIACLKLIETTKPQCQAILLAHCREEAYRVYDVIAKLCSNLAITVRVSVGGTMIKQERIALLAGHTQLIVGTPGRVCDLLSRRLISTELIGFLGLIEVDELICRGFHDQIRDIVGELPGDCQVALSSSALSPDVQEIVSKCMRDPQLIETSRNDLNQENIRHFFITCSHQQKMCLLFDNIQLSSCLIFIKNSQRAQDIITNLKENQFEVKTVADCDQLLKSQSNGDEMRILPKKIVLCIETEHPYHKYRHISADLIINFDMPAPHEYIWRATVGGISKSRRKRTIINLVTHQERQLVNTLKLAYSIPTNELPFYE